MVSKFVEVWQAILSFIVETFDSILPVFYTAESGLTFIGTMAVIMAGIAIVLLVWNLFRSFFSMHG